MDTGSAGASMCAPPRYQAEVGGSPRLRLFPLIFKSSSADDAAVIFFFFIGVLMSCDIKLRSGILPDSSYCPIYLKALRPMLPFSFYYNKISTDSFHQAEVGGSLGLLSLIHISEPTRPY